MCTGIDQRQSPSRRARRSRNQKMLAASTIVIRDHATGSYPVRACRCLLYYRATQTYGTASGGTFTTNIPISRALASPAIHYGQIAATINAGCAICALAKLQRKGILPGFQASSG